MTEKSSIISIEPIGLALQQQVVDATTRYILQGSDHFGRAFDQVPVRFDLKGRAAGMYQVQNRQRFIRYNPYLFAKYYDDNLQQTVPHEVAHYLCDVVYGLRSIRPHGAEWKQLMYLFGARIEATCRYDLAGIPSRSQRRHPYRCQCTTHLLSTRRHNNVTNRRMRYFCRSCGMVLKPT
jgi:SprT protein